MVEVIEKEIEKPIFFRFWIPDNRIMSEFGSWFNHWHWRFGLSIGN